MGTDDPQHEKPASAEQQVAAPRPDEDAVLPYARARRTSRGRPFYFIEIIMGLAILSMLLALAVPMFMPVGTSRPRPRPICRSDLRAVGIALRLYHEDYGRFPDRFEPLVRAGFLTPTQLRCSRSDPRDARVTDFYLVLGLTQKDPGNWILAFDHPQNHGGTGGFILHVDGKVEWVDAESFERQVEGFCAEYEKARGSAPVIRPPE